MREVTKAWASVMIALLAVVTPAAWAQAQDASEESKSVSAEAEMGKQAAEQIEKEFKVLEDPATLERLTRIIARLQPHTQRLTLEYQVKVLAGDDLNAFSLPAGYIYVTKPLLEAVESEDELAAVIAHEMAHINLKHGLELATREARINNRAALAVLAGVLASDKVDPGNVVMLAALVRTGLLTGYSRRMELGADAHAVTYLHEAGYHPVAMLTVVEGLARLEKARPHVEMGIFKTHPYPEERARALRQQLLAMGLSLNPRLVLGTLKTKAEAVQEEDRVIGRMSLDDYVVFEPAVTADGLTPQQRAEKTAADLGRLLLDDLRMYELHTVVAADHALILARGEPVVKIVPGDAEFHGTTMAELAARAQAKIKLALWQEAVRRAY